MEHQKMDVVMNIKTKGGVEQEVRLKWGDSPEDVARAFILANNMKSSLVPALAGVIRNRRDEILSAAAATGSSSNDAPVAPSVPAPSAAPAGYVASSSAGQPNPFDAFESTKPVSAGHPHPHPHTHNSSNSSSNSSGNSSNRSTSTVHSETEGIWKQFELANQDQLFKAQNFSYGTSSGTSTSQSGANQAFDFPQPSAAYDLHNVRKGRETSSEAGREDSEKRESVKSEVRQQYDAQIAISSTTSASTAAEGGRRSKQVRISTSLSPGRQDLGLSLRIFPRSSSISPSSRNGSMRSNSPRKPIKNQQSVERLHGEHERMMDRHRARSEYIARSKQEKIESTKFREAVGFLRNSPSAKQANHYGRREGQTFQEWLYESDMKWAAVRDKTVKKQKLILAEKREKELMDEVTFKPELVTKNDSFSRDVSRTMSVFDALYESRSFYQNRVEVLKQRTQNEIMSGAVFSPKIIAPATERLAKKWRDREDERQERDRDNDATSKAGLRSNANTPVPPMVDTLTLEDLSNSHSSRVHGGRGLGADVDAEAARSPSRMPVRYDDTVIGASQVTLLEAASASQLNTTNPFDEFVSPDDGLQIAGQERERVEEEWRKDKPGESEKGEAEEKGEHRDVDVDADANMSVDNQDEQPSHLSFFDSFVATTPAKPTLTISTPFDAPFEETKNDDIFSLLELAAAAMDDAAKQMASQEDAGYPPAKREATTPRATDKLFDRLFRYDASAAVESARKKHEKEYSYLPDVAKTASTLKGEEDLEAFCQRLSTRCEPKPLDLQTLTIGKKPIDPLSKQEMLTRMTVKYPKRSEEQRKAALSEVEKNLKEMRGFHTDSRSELIARRARQASLAEIFQLLLASVDYSKDREAKKAAQKAAQDQETSVANPSSWRDQHSPILPASSTSGPPAMAEVEKGHLDTRYAMPGLLQPKSLVVAVSTIIRDVYPASLSLKAFVSAMETLIVSGRCVPISAFLCAPDRILGTLEIPQERKGHKLDLKARVATELLAKNRRPAPRKKFLDADEYISSREQRLAAIRRKVEDESLKECTFVPVLAASDTYQSRRKKRASPTSTSTLTVSNAYAANLPGSSATVGAGVPATPSADGGSVMSSATDAATGTLTEIAASAESLFLAHNKATQGASTTNSTTTTTTTSTSTTTTTADAAPPMLPVAPSVVVPVAASSSRITAAETGADLGSAIESFLAASQKSPMRPEAVIAPPPERVADEGLSSLLPLPSSQPMWSSPAIVSQATSNVVYASPPLVMTPDAASVSTIATAHATAITSTSTYASDEPSVIEGLAAPLAEPMTPTPTAPSTPTSGVSGIPVLGSGPRSLRGGGRKKT